MKIRQGKDIILRWKITTNGEALPLEGRNLTLVLSTPNGRERVLSYTTEGDTISTRLFGKEITLLGDYTLTLWENRGEQGQTAVDAVNAFELVKYTSMEEDGSPCGNLEAEVLNLSGELGVFQQGTTTEKNEQVDRNTTGIAELHEDVNAINITLDDLEKADASLREEIANIKDKDAEQDEEITSLLDILEGKLDIKDLGSGRSPDQAVSEIIQYVRSNEIKSALVFKYIDTDNSSTFGICISRTGTSGWIIYLVARKGLEVLKFNSRGSRETWNEYGGVLRHDMNSVADEQLECLSIKGLKSVLAKKQDALVSGTNIKSINGQSILGSGNIKIETGITEEEKAEINAKIEGKADIADVEELRQEVEEKAPKVGYAPDLKVNFAKELVGRGEATPEVIGGIRPTGVRSIGDGNSSITKIKGESVVWNQLAFPLNDENYATINKQVSSLTFANGIATLTAIQLITAEALGAIRPRLNRGFNIIKNHKMLAIYRLRSSLDNLRIYSSFTGSRFILTQKWNDYSVFFSEVTDRIDSKHYICFTKNTEPGTTLECSLISTYDLTLMFGAGNEPTTIEEFEARKPLGVSNEYNEGTIVSYNGEALKSVGFNAFNGTYAKVIGGQIYHATGTTSISFAKELDGDTTAITLDSNGKFTPTEDGYVYAEGKDIVIHLTHSYTPEHVDEYEEDVHALPDVKSILDAEGNQLFPHGLLSAGSVHDEITATKAIKRVGVVVLDGSEQWGLQSVNSYGIANFSLQANFFNMSYAGISDRFITQYTSIADTQNEGIMWAKAGYIYIRIKSTTSSAVAQLKTWLSQNNTTIQGVLDTPIEVDLPEPLNMTYEAWDFGTEELIAEGATTPLNAEIVYQFNAVDRIRENSKHVEESQEILANKADKTTVEAIQKKELQLSVLDNGNIVLSNDNGDRQEFMPATPSGDPMHYAYVSAGAKYNATDNFILKDAPWKGMVDTIEDKAKWGLDVVDASKVKQMTIGGVAYNYATDNRTSPEGGTYLRYFLVGQGSNGVWVEDETRVLCPPGCWYLNGLGDITNAEMMRIVENKFIVSVWDKGRAVQSIKTRTLLHPYTVVYTDGIGDIGNLHGVKIESFTLNINSFKIVSIEYCIPTGSIVGKQDNLKYFACLKNLSNITHNNVRVLPINKLAKSVTISSPVISKESIRQNILNATPSSAITITLHHDAYERLKGDADILQALTTKNADLATKGDGKVSLVCATEGDTIPTE